MLNQYGYLWTISLWIPPDYNLSWQPSFTTSKWSLLYMFTFVKGLVLIWLGTVLHHLCIMIPTLLYIYQVTFECIGVTTRWHYSHSLSKERPTKTNCNWCNTSATILRIIIINVVNITSQIERLIIIKYVQLSK